MIFKCELDERGVVLRCKRVRAKLKACKTIVFVEADTKVEAILAAERVARLKRQWRENRERGRAMAKALGLCPNCGTRPIEEGRAICRACRESNCGAIPGSRQRWRRKCAEEIRAAVLQDAIAALYKDPHALEGWLQAELAECRRIAALRACVRDGVLT